MLHLVLLVLLPLVLVLLALASPPLRRYAGTQDNRSIVIHSERKTSEQQHPFKRFRLEKVFDSGGIGWDQN